MTPRQRVEAVLRGERADHIPFTCYTDLLPRGETERQLRAAGLALIQGAATFSETRLHVEFETREEWHDGRRFIRQTYHTPVGRVSELLRTGGAYGTSLRCEFLIKRPEDYEIMEFLVRDTVYAPDYDAYLTTVDNLGEDGFVFGWVGYTPLLQMLVMWMGPERWALDMADHPREFFGLYDLLTERHRELYELCAASPAWFFKYGDNVTAEMIGRERFSKYCVPRYNECAQVLHASGKLVASHLDGKMKALADLVADSDLDCIEAFAAFPDGDLEIGEARRIWSDKIIWTNFPSPLHLQPPDQIEAYCHEMLQAVAPGDGFLVGVTENIPQHCWQTSMTTISRMLGDYGNLPLKS